MLEFMQIWTSLVFRCKRFTNKNFSKMSNQACEVKVKKNSENLFNKTNQWIENEKDSFNKTNIKSSLVLVISRLPLPTSLSLLCNSFSFTGRNPNPCKKDILLSKFLINLFSQVRYIHQQLFVFKRLYCSTSYPLPKRYANVIFPHKSFFLCSPHYTHYYFQF